jgi:Uma2 family endonuclease
MDTQANVAADEIEYPESDGKPMAETDLHRRLMAGTIERLTDWFTARTDVYVSGNLLVYYEKGNIEKCLAPDCFVVFGVPAGERRTYKVWEEGKFPDFVLEITSRKTKAEDRGEKLRIYRDVWQVREYVLFDPREEYLKPSFQGFRLTDGEYAPIPLAHGQLASEVLGLRLERSGARLVFRNPVTGHEVVSRSEEEARRAREEAELADLRAAALEAELEDAIEDHRAARAEIDRALKAQADLQAQIDQLKTEVEALRSRQPPN